MAATFGIAALHTDIALEERIALSGLLGASWQPSAPTSSVTRLPNIHRIESLSDRTARPIATTSSLSRTTAITTTTIATADLLSDIPRFPVALAFIRRSSSQLS